VNLFNENSFLSIFSSTSFSLLNRKALCHRQHENRFEGNVRSVFPCDCFTLSRTFVCTGDWFILLNIKADYPPCVCHKEVVTQKIKGKKTRSVFIKSLT